MFIRFRAAAVLASSVAGAAFAEAPGLMEVTFPGDRPLEAHVIYPTEAAGPASPYGDRPVWAPIQVQPNAEPSGQHPVVVLSHGMFGHRWNQLWLGAALAEAGYVTVAVNHPGTTFMNRDPELSRQLWERPADIARVLEGLSEIPELEGHIDLDAAYAVGHSLGGWTVLGAAGARFDVDLLGQTCAEAPGQVACSAFDVLGVRAEDADALGQDMSVPGLRAVVALDPGGTVGFTEASLAALTTPTMVVAALRTPEHVDAAQDSGRVAELAPVRYMPMAEAGHFDFLGVCKEGALALLQAEMPEDAMVCDRGRAERQAVQAVTVAAILDFFSEAAGE